MPQLKVQVYAQSYSCNPMDCSPQGSSVHGILQARILEWVSFPTPGDLPDSRIDPTSFVSPALAGTSLPGKPKSLRAVTKDLMCCN